jgi:hypothetical protein
MSESSAVLSNYSSPAVTIYSWRIHLTLTIAAGIACIFVSSKAGQSFSGPQLIWPTGGSVRSSMMGRKNEASYSICAVFDDDDKRVCGAGGAGYKRRHSKKDQYKNCQASLDHSEFRTPGNEASPGRATETDPATHAGGAQPRPGVAATAAAAGSKPERGHGSAEQS